MAKVRIILNTLNLYFNDLLYFILDTVVILLNLLLHPVNAVFIHEISYNRNFFISLCLGGNLSYTEIGRHIINQSNNVIYEDRKNQVYGIG